MSKENILGFNVCNKREEQIISEIFEDYNKNIQNFIVNINPEIIINNYKDKKLIDELNSQKYQIPDGIRNSLCIKNKKRQYKGKNYWN